MEGHNKVPATCSAIFSQDHLFKKENRGIHNSETLPAGDAEDNIDHQNFVIY